MASTYKNFFRGKKITVMGLGLLGRGAGDVKFLAESGADLIVTDLKNGQELAPSLQHLKKFSNIQYVLGRHRLSDFRGRDFILKAAGVPFDSLYIAEARKNNIQVEMSTALFARLSGAKIIGVTGTRGKSTTTYLIYHILRTAGRKVFLGGNVRGVSTLSLLKKVKPGDLVVLELDSWQLQGFGESKISPQIAVFTNLLPDHLNYYGGSMEKYFADKANIFKYQKPGDYLILGGQCRVPRSWKFKLLGKHNLNNIALAIKAAEILGVARGVIKKAVEHFRGVPGRLEMIRVWRGIKIYNDTTSTTPDALIAGLKALGHRLEARPPSDRRIILIMGGADKGLEMAPVLPLIRRFCKALILLPGTGTDRLKPKTCHLKPFTAPSLKEALQQAKALASRDDIILFSPAFASFGPPPGGFKNEYDRGEQFSRLVKKLK